VRQSQEKLMLENNMGKKTITSEYAFETAIEQSLLSQGYFKGDPKKFDRVLALETSEVVTFLKESQPDEWKKISETHGAGVEEKVIFRLVQTLDRQGMLDVLRNGFTDYGVKFQMAFFKPETTLNEEEAKRYGQNRLMITRQVKYSEKNENSLDIVLFLNGLPISTIELKNQFTGQDTNNAKKQYAYDRDPREPIFQFKKRTLVHFAVDADEVYMTTKLEGKNTKYLPFNLGYKNGAGNPANQNGYKTAYLWESILSKESLMDILGRFMHLQREKYLIDGVEKIKETMIFPRYHQLDVVRKLVTDAKNQGVGKNYLIEHSAGSGKSNSIAWLSHRLSGLHNEKDIKVFNSIIVVTDRTVLDQQLQETIFQFEHKGGVVAKIDKSSQQLADEIKASTPVIVTTLQKFPFAAVLEEIKNLPERNYAVIVDEAHSSHGGEATKKMKEVLSAKSLDEAEQEDIGDSEDTEDEIRKSMESRGRQSNLSFFAFTATPKAKTLEYFGEKGSDGKPRPFHLYSMRQAVEEGFILDVLKNYTTYKTYFRLSKSIEDDPELNKKKANVAIGRFVSLHPTNIAQKTEVMVEHFRQVTSKKIGGKAKAMVVTSSRLHAIKYYQEFKRYIKERGYPYIKPLVAFSGKVIDEFGQQYTEPEMNGFGEKELPKRFDTFEYQLLLVADKYQTGFDQPLLHTMYVDKRLEGVKAVQTLSRLNRTTAGKDDTFVLDFVNDLETIRDSFQPYYEMTTLTEEADPNLLYDLKSKLESAQVYTDQEVNKFCSIFFKSPDKQSTSDQAQLYAWVQPAVDRFSNLESDEKQEEVKNQAISFVRLYSFLSQIMPFSDIELEKLYVFLRLLLTKLPRPGRERLKLGDEIALEYYRLQKTSESQIVLDESGEVEIKPISEVGMTKDKEERMRLSEIIDVLNERFGTNFTEADRLFFDQIEEELASDETLSEQAKSNSMENFKYGFNDAFLSKLVERMDQNEEIFNKIMDNKEFSDVVKEYLIKKVYGRANKKD